MPFFSLTHHFNRKPIYFHQDQKKKHHFHKNYQSRLYFAKKEYKVTFFEAQCQKLHINWGTGFSCFHGPDGKKAKCRQQKIKVGIKNSAILQRVL